MSTDINSLGPYAAVDLDIFVRKTGTQLGYFGYASLEELLSTAA